MPNLPAFLSYVFITTFTPGPNNIMSMSNSSRYGLKNSIHFNYGVFAGFFLVLALSNLFSRTLFNIIPMIKPYMTFIGAGYITWLAWKTFRSKPPTDANHERVNRTTTFTKGFLLQFVNPKGIIYGVTTASTFIVPYYSSPVFLLLFALIMAALGFISTVSWGIFGSVFQLFMTEHHKLVNSIMALLLLYTAISLFL
ncbi:LysE family transporter [Gudongella sp. DL1XJH-153]|uniref:LysE family transporter n=1 Tax=Gudongella sp. DL1XJH-153 TaxID=3409804 RepID=UPI003BB4CD20